MELFETSIKLCDNLFAYRICKVLVAMLDKAWVATAPLITDYTKLHKPKAPVLQLHAWTTCARKPSFTTKFAMIRSMVSY